MIGMALVGTPQKILEQQLVARHTLDRQDHERRHIETARLGIVAALLKEVAELLGLFETPRHGLDGVVVVVDILGIHGQHFTLRVAVVARPRASMTESASASASARQHTRFKNTSPTSEPSFQVAMRWLSDCKNSSLMRTITRWCNARMRSRSRSCCSLAKLLRYLRRTRTWSAHLVAR